MKYPFKNLKLSSIMSVKIIDPELAKLKALNPKSYGMLKHGHELGRHQTKTYCAWANMKRRCFNPNHPSFRYYGGRGITVCERWLDFESFFEDMGVAPFGMTLERKNNDGNYEPENCRWATTAEQALNNRKNVHLTIHGRTQTLKEWCDEAGISKGTVRGRLSRGWSNESAIQKPADKKYAHVTIR